MALPVGISPISHYYSLSARRRDGSPVDLQAPAVPDCGAEERNVKQTTAIGAALTVATVVVVGLFYVMPSLNSAPRKVEEEASVHLERARRLLYEYNANLGFQDLLVQSLRDLDVHGDQPQDLSDDGASAYQEAHTNLWKAYTPVDGIDPSRPATANYGNIDSQIQTGVRNRESLIKENAHLLDEAKQEIGQALAVSVDGASARNDAEANRLQAMVAFYAGQALRLQAMELRNEAATARRDLTDLAGKVEALKTSMTILDSSGLDKQLDQLRQHLEERTQAVAAREKERDGLADQVQKLKDRIAELKAQRDKARHALDDLRQHGIDFTDPKGAQDFTDELTEQDRVYREKVRQLESLEAGSYPYAQIDATGDFVHGHYLENGSPANLTIEPGLSHYEAELAVTDAELKQLKAGLDGMKEDIARLEGMRQDLAAQQAKAVEQVASLKPHAKDIYDELTGYEDDAYKLEDQALDRFTASARSAQQAASGSSQWISDAQSHTSGMSPQALERSAFEDRTKARWMTGHIEAQGADAELAKAWIYLDRFEAAQRDAELYASLPSDLELTDADAAAEREDATAARDAGVEAVTKADTILKRAHGDADRNWTFVAQEAGATYLMVLFGDKSFKADAVAAYREALKGREDKPYTQQLAARLKQLEAD